MAFNLDFQAKTADLLTTSNHKVTALQEQPNEVCETIGPIHSAGTNSDSMHSNKKSPKASVTEEAKEISELNKGTEQLSLDSLLRETKFVINTIAYVPEREFSDDSSSEEMDGRFSGDDFNFDVKNKSSFPFTTTRPKNKSKKFGFEEISGSNQSDSISTVITPLLEKLSENGFEKDDKDKITTSISASIALNRMKSLSTRKNKSLHLELKSKVKTDIRYEKFGFFWVCDWYDKTGESIDESSVRKFYKQLKTINPEKAKEYIRAMEEKNIDVPYQNLREYAKDHDKTKKLVQEFRKKEPNAHIYLSLIDSDTVDFNGIYSAYLRIVKGCEVKLPVPTVMSTGFEYPKDKPDYQFGSQVDRMIRVYTARHIPLGVYYPEPNVCILIEPGCSTLPESFIDKKRTKGNLESVCLIKKIQERKNATFIFSEDKPLITAIPANSEVPFTSEFGQGASPTQKDLKRCKSVPHSSFKEYVWYTNLFINDGIKFRTYDLKDYVNDAKNLQLLNDLLTSVRKREKSEDSSRDIEQLKEHIRSDVVDVMVKKYILQHCKHLVSIIRNPEGTEAGRKEAINELKKYVNVKVADLIVKAVEEVNKYIKNKKIEIRSKNENKLLVLMKKYKIKIDCFSKDERQMLAQPPVRNLIKNKLINFQDLIGLDTEVLEYICYDEEIMEMHENKTIDSDSLLKLFKKKFSDYLEVSGNYSISDILKRYKENHLKKTEK